MNYEIQLRDEFGTHPSDGDRAYGFRISQIDPYLNLLGCQVILDFTSIRCTNSSFINALVSGLVEQHGCEVLKKLVVRGCIPPVRMLVEAAIELGMIKHAERV